MFSNPEGDSSGWDFGSLSTDATLSLLDAPGALCTTRPFLSKALAGGGAAWVAGFFADARGVHERARGDFSWESEKLSDGDPVAVRVSGALVGTRRGRGWQGIRGTPGCRGRCMGARNAETERGMDFKHGWIRPMFLMSELFGRSA